MWKRFLNWLDRAQVSDPLQRSQLRVTQGLFLLEICVNLPILLVIVFTSEARLIAPSIIGTVIGVVSFFAALVLIRRGQFVRGVTIGLSGSIIQITISAIPYGVLHSLGALLAYLLPLTLAGLLTNRRTLVIMTAVVCIIITTIAVLEIQPNPLTGYAAIGTQKVGDIVGFTILVLAIGGALGLFRGTFERVLREAFERQTELETLRGSLEVTVTERTAALQSALITVEQREVHLTQTLEDLQTSRTTIRDLSAPIIPVLAGVLVTPLVGAIDTQRASDFAQNLLAAVEHQRATYVILDVTGMLVIDTQVAQLLLQTATSVRLLGAQALLAGVRPEVAQTIVSLGADLHAIPTFSDLRSAVESLVQARLPAARTNGTNEGAQI